MTTPPHPPLVIVAGAAGGMGSALCELLLSRQWAVLAIDHNRQRLQNLVERSQNRPLWALEMELDSPDLVTAVERALPPELALQGLVYLAAQSVGDEIHSLSDEDWERSLSINVTPAMKLARFAAPHMKAAGSGSIVNVGSPVAIVGARKPSYAASKAALSGLTMSLARNLGSSPPVRVNLVLPGPTVTPLTDDWSEAKRQKIAEGSFLKRLCRPEEIAAIIAFLLSDEASYVTGCILDATAGSMFGH